MLIHNTPVFDAHFHIIDPRYPIQANHGYRPEPFSCDDYRTRMQAYNLLGGAVVSGSFQGMDQSYLISALKQLGAGFVGVTQLPVDVSDKDLVALDQHGIRAIRFNLRRGGSEYFKYLTSMANRVYDLVGWHVELYVDGQSLPELQTTLLSLPVVCIDHLGLSKVGFDTLLSLVEHGVYVKASGFSRVDFDVRTALTSLIAANPNAILFGTDLPSTRAPLPYQDDDFQLLVDTIREANLHKVLYQNAQTFYKFDQNGKRWQSKKSE